MNTNTAQLDSVCYRRLHAKDFAQKPSALLVVSSTGSKEQWHERNRNHQ